MVDLLLMNYVIEKKVNWDINLKNNLKKYKG